MKKLTQQQLDQLTAEMQDFMESSGRKKFPPAKIDELRELGAKRCSKCATVKPLESFPKHSRTRDGLKGICKSCNCATDANYRKHNPDKVREYKREYYTANREQLNEYRHTRYYNEELYRLRMQLSQGYYRAVEAGNEASWIEPEELLLYWSAKNIPALTCYLSSEELTPFDRSVDHVIAIGNGGGHVVENLMPATLEANLRKNNLTPDDALARFNQ